MNVSTRFLLVLLQLVIGWHLLYEGWWKLNEPSWSSRGYLRNAQGPAALWLRYAAGDPEVQRKDGQFVVTDPTAELIARFTIKPLDPNEPPEDRHWHKHLPPMIEEEWDAYFAAFVQRYNLKDAEPFPSEPAGGLMGGLAWGALADATLQDAANPLQPGVQRLLAERNFLLAKAETAKWIAEGEKKVKRPTISGGEVPLRTPQRLKEYLDKVEEARNLETIQLNTFGPKVMEKYRKAKAEEGALRAGLLSDLNDRTNQMKRSLRDVLTYEQKRMPPPEEKAVAAAEWTMLPWIDWIVKWGLLLAGAGLMLGLFTRLAGLAGAVLLLLFYAAMPPLLGLPGNPLSDGHYLIINVNIIEIVALLTIVAAHTGRWYGLDAWLDPLKPWRWRSAARAVPPPATRPPHAPAVKEIPSGNGGAILPRK
jgi:uncharacterized membrane protein YphA (DoxX/SURF4 family)